MSVIKLPASEFVKTDHFKKMLKDFELKLEDFTCNDCEAKEDCPCSYDPYNTKGDCLYLK